MSDIKQPEVKKEVEVLAEALRASGKLDEENNAVSFDKNAFKDNLPEGLSIDTVKTVNRYTQNFALAQMMVTSELAMPHLKKNKDVERVISKTDIPLGKIATQTLREFTKRNVKTGEETVVYGHAAGRIVVKVPGSGLQAVRNRVAELAKKEGLGA